MDEITNILPSACRLCQAKDARITYLERTIAQLEARVAELTRNYNNLENEFDDASVLVSSLGYPADGTETLEERIERMVAQLEAQIAELRKDAERQWRQIETAPKDGWFLCRRFGRVVMARRSKDPEYAIEFFDPEYADSPHLRFNAASDITEWAALPASAPEKEGGR